MLSWVAVWRTVGCSLEPLWPARVVVRDLNADLARVLAAKGEAVPEIGLSAAGDDDVSEIYPGFADEFGLAVIVEDGQLELVVVGRVADGESELLVPEFGAASQPSSETSTARSTITKERGMGERGRTLTHHFGVWPPRMSVAVLLASLPRRAAQYGSCLPIVLRLGRFFARSMTTMSVPMSGPSTELSPKMPAVCAPLADSILEAIMYGVLGERLCDDDFATTGR